MATDSNVFLAIAWAAFAISLGGMIGGAMLCADDHYWLGIPVCIIGIFSWTVMRAASSCIKKEKSR